MTVVDAKTKAITIKKIGQKKDSKPEDIKPRDKLNSVGDSDGERPDPAEKSERQIRKEAELQESLKEVEEIKLELSLKGLCIENEVADTELEDLWEKEVLGMIGAKKAVKKLKRKDSKKKEKKTETTKTKSLSHRCNWSKKK